MEQLLCIENTCRLYFLDLLLLFFFFIQSREPIYEPPRIKFTLWHCNTSIELNQKENRFLLFMFLNLLDILNEVHR